MAVKILEDLCDCRPSVSEHLLQIGLEREEAGTLAEIIKTEIELSTEPVEGKEKLREYLLIKKILDKVKLNEEMTAQVCQVARNAYKDYWYRKDLLKQGMKSQEEEPWEIAARNTLNLYKSTKPSVSELNKASAKIQAAYRGYHVRRNVLRHLLPKKDRKQGRTVNLSGPPVDVAASREADLGPLINIRTAVQEDNVEEMFDTERTEELGLAYDPQKTITHVESEEDLLKAQESGKQQSRGARVKMAGFADETPRIDHAAVMAAESKNAGKNASKSASQSSPSKVNKSVTGQFTNDESDAQSATVYPSINRISFSEVPPEVIENYVEPDSKIDEVPEEIPGDTSADSTGLSGLDTTDATDGEEEEEEE